MSRVSRIAALVLIFIVGSLAPAQSTTPNLGLSIPAHGAEGWDTAIANDLTAIDTVVGQLQSAYQGNWSNTTSYQKGQTVTFGGVLYQSLTANTGSTPSTSPSQWTAVLTIPSASNWPNAGTCTTGQYVNGLANGSAPTCAAIAYSQLTGTPTIPTAANWPGSGSCPAGQYMVTLSNGSTPTCAAIPYSSVTGTPTIPTTSNWPGAGSCSAGYYFSAIANGAAPTCTQIAYSQITGTPTGLPPTGSASGDLSGSFPSPTVKSINGTLLSGLSTGLLKNTTGTGVPSIATPGTDYQIPISVTTTGSNCGTPTFSAGVLNLPPCSGGSSPTAGTGIAVSGSTVINAGNTDKNAVTSLGLDNTGATDITSALSTFFNSGSNLSLYVPCGTYKQTSPITVSATVSAGQNIRVYAASPDCVTINLTFSAGLSNADAWWWDNTAAGNNNYGPSVDGIVFNDTTSANVHSAVRVTNYANVGRMNFKVVSFNGVQYQTGSVTATNGSTAVTLSGGTFPAAACPGGHLWIAGHYQEVNSCSGTSATLTIPWQYTTASASAYSLDYNGIGLLLDGGSSFVQYNKEPLIVRAAGVRVGVDALGSPSSSSGVSRFDFGPGYINCNRVPDSMAFFLGDYSDTFTVSTKANNCSRFAHLENSHAALILAAKFENAGTGTAAYGCTASPHTYSCNVGVEAIGNSSSANARGNKVIASYFYDTGTGVTWDQYNNNFVVDANDIETFANDSPIVPPATGTTGYTTAEVHDPTLQLQPGGVITIAPVSLAVASYPVPAGTCYGSSGSTTPATFTFAGLTSSMGITPRYTGNISGVSGWGTGGIKLDVWPTATPGQGQYLVCNTSTSLITPAAITFSLEAK